MTYWLRTTAFAVVFSLSFSGAALAADEEEVTFDPENACIIAMPKDCDSWCTDAPAAANYKSKAACIKVCKSNAALCKHKGMPGY